jgi:hypothetical protein
VLQQVLFLWWLWLRLRRIHAVLLVSGGAG